MKCMEIPRIRENSRKEWKLRVYGSGRHVEVLASWEWKDLKDPAYVKIKDYEKRNGEFTPDTEKGGDWVYHLAVTVNVYYNGWYWVALSFLFLKSLLYRQHCSFPQTLASWCRIFLPDIILHIPLLIVCIEVTTFPVNAQSSIPCMSVSYTWIYSVPTHSVFFRIGILLVLGVSLSSPHGIYSAVGFNFLNRFRGGKIRGD